VALSNHFAWRRYASVFFRSTATTNIGVMMPSAKRNAFRIAVIQPKDVVAVATAKPMEHGERANPYSAPDAGIGNSFPVYIVYAE